MASILIVDDDSSIRTHLAAGVCELGHEAEVAADAMEALAVMDRSACDVVLSDIRMAGMDGLTLLRELRRRHPNAGVVLMTAYATVPDAVEAIRGGAYDYLVKPFSLEQVGLVLARLLEVQTLRHENRALRQAVEAPLPLESRNPTMQQILATARRAAASDAAILVIGEHGVGKSVMAAAIHRWSPRASRTFVTIPCTTLADHVLESELFGQVRGAFTGAWRDKPGVWRPPRAAPPSSTTSPSCRRSCKRSCSVFSRNAASSGSAGPIPSPSARGLSLPRTVIWGPRSVRDAFARIFSID